jgi:hypothetical protein
LLVSMEPAGSGAIVIDRTARWMTGSTR